jgi:hypothetical protein
MGTRADVTRDVGPGEAAGHVANGVKWYYDDDSSWGFAHAAAVLNRNSCDAGGADPETRMCWHVNEGHISSGYRCGNNDLNGAEDWVRLMYRPIGAN